MARRIGAGGPFLVASATSPELQIINTGASRGVDQPFQTYLSRSRHVVNAKWLAALAPAAAVAAVPVSAWIVRPLPKRKEAKRLLVAAPALQWQYIAPTIAAILPRAKVIKVDFKRKPMADRPLVTSAQPTGPPVHVAWAAAVAVKRVSHRKWLVRVLDQASYPATPAAQTYPGVSAEPFVTRVTKSRKLLKPSDVVGVNAAAPQVTPAVYPSFVPKQLPPFAFKRRLQELDSPIGVGAAAPTVSQAPIAALYQSRFKKRKPRPGLFLSSGAETISLAATSTAAVYPSFVPRPVKRVEHKRKLQQLASPIGVAAATPANLYPAFVLKRLPAVTHKRKLVKLAAPIGVSAQAVFPSFVLLRPNRAVQKRKLLQLSSPIGVDAAPIVTTPALYPSYLPPRVNVVAFKRTLLTLVDTVGVALTAPPPTDEQVTGGWAFYNHYAIERTRRIRRKREDDEREQQIATIQEPVSREIAELLAKQEREATRRAELERLRTLARDFADQKAEAQVSKRLADAFERARERETISALLNLERELRRMYEDEEVTILMLLIND